MKILETTNYAQFQKLEGNRQVNRNHVNKLKKSMQESGLFPTVAVVDRNNRIIDGQHRLEAVKELGLKFRYVVSESEGIQDAQSMNIAQRSWNIQDFIDSYASMGNKNYIDLKIDMKKWNISYLVAVAICGGSAENIKKGSLVYKSSAKNDGLIYYAIEIQPFVGTKVSIVWIAIKKVITTDGYSHSKMIKQLNAFRGSDKLGSRVDLKGYLIMFEEIYNYHSKKHLRFY